uniref:Uncharacterized protein n=1 Tax=Rhizophora mucronata TaxID=61149 RepID=A0A2P2NLY0_RHIMU
MLNHQYMIATSSQA